MKGVETLAPVKQNETFGKELVHEKTKKLASHCVGSVEAPRMNAIFI